MTLTPAPAGFSQAMFGTQQASLLDATFDRLLGFELQGARMDAGTMAEFATRVTASIGDHFEPLSAALPSLERQNIERIAADNGIETRPATVEYLANAYLFRAIRDYFDLPRRDLFPQFDAGGFLVFTGNGSIVASPPEEPGRKRTLHYARMPSRKGPFQTNTVQGRLERDIAVGHRLRTTAFNTSAVRMLLYLPPERADLFDAIREGAVAASRSVSMIVTRFR